MPAPVTLLDAPPLAEGAFVRFRLHLPPPVRRVGRYRSAREDGFVDVMVEGPFEAWRHEHRYRALDEGRTEVLDRVDAAPRSATSGLLWAGLPAAFAYRAWATRRACERG